MRLPLRVKRHRLARAGSKILNGFPVAKEGPFAIGLGVPAGEGIAVAPVRVVRDRVGRVIAAVAAVARHISLAAVRVEHDPVADRRPDRIQAHLVDAGRRIGRVAIQILNLFGVSIQNVADLGVRIFAPAREEIARLCKGIGCQRRRLVKGHGLALHAALAAVGVEDDLVFHRRPLLIEMHDRAVCLAEALHRCADGIRRALAVGHGIPVFQRVAGTRGGEIVKLKGLADADREVHSLILRAGVEADRIAVLYPVGVQIHDLIVAGGIGIENNMAVVYTRDRAAVAVLIRIPAAEARIRFLRLRDPGNIAAGGVIRLLRRYHKGAAVGVEVDLIGHLRLCIQRHVSVRRQSGNVDVLCEGGIRVPAEDRDGHSFIVQDHRCGQITVAEPRTIRKRTRQNRGIISRKNAAAYFKRDHAAVRPAGIQFRGRGIIEPLAVGKDKLCALRIRIPTGERQAIRMCEADRLGIEMVFLCKCKRQGF